MQVTTICRSDTSCEERSNESVNEARVVLASRHRVYHIKDASQPTTLLKEAFLINPHHPALLLTSYLSMAPRKAHGQAGGPTRGGTRSGPPGVGSADAQSRLRGGFADQGTLQTSVSIARKSLPLG